MEMIATNTGGTGNAGKGGDAGEAVISTALLRAQTMQRLAGVQERLECKGIGAAFLRAAKADPVGEFEVLNSLILHGIVGNLFADALAESLPSFMAESLCEAFNYLSAGADGATALRDYREQKDLTRRGTAHYPKGRRKDPMQKDKKKVKRKFNRVAANQNRRSAAVQSELGFMFEMQDMLWFLDRQAVGTGTVQAAAEIVKTLVDVSPQQTAQRVKSQPKLAV